MNFDRSKIPHREWHYQDEDKDWRQGVILHPDYGVSFWGERIDGDDGGAYGLSFQKFLSTKDFKSTPVEIIEAIRHILEEARIKKR